jgi:uncharacterized membrane protein YphA (DoxX/SURF4 family)
MITSPKQQPSTYTTNGNTIAKQAIALIRWPFTNRLSSPIWLALRLYIAWIWFQMGMSKLQAGWLTSDPVGAMFKLVEKGAIAVPLPFYREVAGGLLDAGISPMISHSMPFLELAVALSFATGVLVPAAAVGAILLNINIILSGIGAPAFDGPIIAAQILFLMSYRVVGGIGFERLAGRILSAALRIVRPARKQAVAIQAAEKI